MKITKDQTELTPEQLEIAKEYAQDQIKKFLSTTRVSKKEVEKYALNAYKISGKKLPKKIKWFKSPEAMCLHWASVRDSVWDSVRDSVWDSVWDSVRASVWDSVNDSVWDSVNDSVWDSVRASVRDSVWDSVGASVRDSVWDSVRASVWDSVGASVRDSVWDSVNDSVRDSVRAYYDADYNSFLGFFHKYYEENKIVWLLKLSENTTGYAFYKDECWLVDKPKTLTLDEQGKLHNTTGKAIEWKDGYGFYFIHGVKFDEKLFKRVTKNIHAKTIMSIENMEQRMAVLKLHGVDKIIKKGKLVDKSNRGNELYLIKDVFTRDALYLKYQCPSTGRVYISGVDPSLPHDADEAMAWKFNISKNYYLSLEVES